MSHLDVLEDAVAALVGRHPVEGRVVAIVTTADIAMILTPSRAAISMRRGRVAILSPRGIVVVFHVRREVVRSDEGHTDPIWSRIGDWLSQQSARSRTRD